MAPGPADPQLLQLTSMLVQAVVDQDNVGNIICKKALELQACTLVMAGSHVSQLQQFMMGSVLRHCTVHCKVPIMIVQ